MKIDKILRKRSTILIALAISWLVSLPLFYLITTQDFDLKSVGMVLLLSPLGIYLLGVGFLINFGSNNTWLGAIVSLIWLISFIVYLIYCKKLNKKLLYAIFFVLVLTFILGIKGCVLGIENSPGY